MKTLISLNAAGFEYFLFMESKDAVHKKYDISERECFILRVISQSYIRNQKMRVSDVLALKDFASPATLHGIVKSLIKKGNLSVLLDAVDGRVKYLEPTPLTLKMYKEMTKNFMKIGRGN